MASDDDIEIEFETDDNTLNPSEQTVNNGTIIPDGRKIKIEQIGSLIFHSLNFSSKLMESLIFQLLLLKTWN